MEDLLTFKTMHHYQLMYLSTFRICTLKFMKSEPLVFLLHRHYGKEPTPPPVAWQGALEKAKVKLNLLPNIDMLLMLKEGIRSGMLCHSLMWES